MVEQLSPEDSAHLVAAMCRLQSQGDMEGVKKLSALAGDPGKLRQIANASGESQGKPNRYPPGYYMTEEQQKAIWDKIFRMDRQNKGLADLIQSIYFGPESLDEIDPEKRQYHLGELKRLFPNGYPTDESDLRQ